MNLEAPVLVSQEQLMAATGYERQGDLRRWLEENGFSYKLGRGGRIVTTVEAVNKAFREGKEEGWEPI